MTKLCGLQQTQRSTNPQKVACRFLSTLGEQLSVLLQNPQLILLALIPSLTALHFLTPQNKQLSVLLQNPQLILLALIPSLTALHFLTPQNTSFLFVKMVRCTFYFKLGNTGYYLNKINRDSSFSIVT